MVRVMRHPILFLGMILCGAAPAMAEVPLQPANLAAVLGVTDSIPASAPVLRSAVRPNVPWSLLAANVKGPVELRVRVDRNGIVDSVKVVKGDPRLISAAIDAAKWCLYAATGVSAWADLRIEIPSAGHAEALSPDPVALALGAERIGDLRGAIDGWTGAISRVGRHPSLQDDLVIRARIITLVQRMPTRLAVPAMASGPAQGAKNRLDRGMSGALSRDVLPIFEQSLAIAPWYGEGYRWKAAALAGYGRIDDARRAVMLFRLATDDSASRALADRAQAALSRADTIGTSQMLKFQ